MIVFDLDGTILDNDLKISHNLIEICCDLKITTKIVIATGRSVSDAIQYYRILDLDTYLICYNGAFIWHPLTKKVYHRTISLMNINANILIIKYSQNKKTLYHTP